MSIFFTADWHLDHANIIKYCNRPFRDVHEMNETIIESHNKIVTPNDEAYVLGDLALCDSRRARKLISRFNGNLHLIRGNHEKAALQCKDLFVWIKRMHEFYVGDSAVRGNKRLVTLCHYAMKVWNKSHWGADSSIHLYGHSHGSLEADSKSASMDVGIDNAARLLGEYRPFSYQEVIGFIKDKIDNNED